MNLYVLYIEFVRLTKRIYFIKRALLSTRRTGGGGNGDKNANNTIPIKKYIRVEVADKGKRLIRL